MRSVRCASQRDCFRRQRGVALARVVFDVHQVRHLREQARIATPQVFAEPVRDQHVGLEFTAHLHQRPDRRGMRPTGDDTQRHAGLFEFGDAARIGAALAAQHEQRLDLRALDAGLRQRDGDLRRAAGEATGDEMQDADGPCFGRTGIDGGMAWRAVYRPRRA